MEQYIYKLTSPSGKCYIGRTTNFDFRMKEHKYEASVNRRDFPVYRAIRKYGWDNFTKEVIATVADETMAIATEESLIRLHDSVKRGYNSTYNTGIGGDVWGGKSEEQKEEFKKKMSTKTAGDKNGMFGKKHSPDAKQKLKEKAKGRFSLPWYCERHGVEEGTRLYNERRERLSQRKLGRDTTGKFATS